MNVKNLKMKVTYRIEAKPGGGFIARAADPSAPSIEAATREELQEKIRTETLEKLAGELPVLKRLLETQFKPGEMVKSKQSSTVVIRTTGSDTVVTELSSSEDRAGVAKELSGLVKKSFPDLSRALAALEDTQTPTVTEDGHSSVSFRTPKQNEVVANAPIVPEANYRWPFVVLALLVLGALMYFASLHR